MRSADLKRAKRDVRRRVLAARDAVDPATLEAAAEAVADRLLGLPEVEAARTVMAFSSFGSELPTGPLIARLDARGVRVALPRIVDGELEPRTFRPGDPVTRASFGALEPAAGRVLDPAEVDVIVTPAVAFDRHGQRVGYGGGFYDRFFPRARPDAFRVGIALAVQLLEEPLPAAAFDLPVHALVTPDETIRCDLNRGSAVG